MGLQESSIGGIITYSLRGSGSEQGKYKASSSRTAKITVPLLNSEITLYFRNLAVVTAIHERCVHVFLGNRYNIYAVDGLACGANKNSDKNYTWGPRALKASSTVTSALTIKLSRRITSASWDLFNAWTAILSDLSRPSKLFLCPSRDADL